MVAGAVPGCGCWKGTSGQHFAVSSGEFWALMLEPLTCSFLFLFSVICFVLSEMVFITLRRLLIATYVLQFYGVFLSKNRFNFSALLNNL